ncbi:MAG TPA: chlorite dismutase family protein [bacterium]|nr:chlorite dismutase family protein [bacterium]
MADAPLVHGFLFFRVPSGHRDAATAAEVASAAGTAARSEGVAGLYAYNLQGLRGDVDLGFWVAAADAETFQRASAILAGTDLELAWSLWGFVRPSQYTGRDGTSVRVPGARRRFLVVYPFSKTHEWYQLSAEDRRAMMTEHARLGHRFDDIEQLLLYCTGLADWEFVVGYETDDLPRFSELVTVLRSTAARPYTLRDTPTFVGRHGPVEEVVRAVIG